MINKKNNNFIIYIIFFFFCKINEIIDFYIYESLGLGDIILRLEKLSVLIISIKIIRISFEDTVKVDLGSVKITFFYIESRDVAFPIKVGGIKRNGFFKLLTGLKIIILYVVGISQVVDSCYIGGV
jgi:hypothetical protein